MQTEVIRLAELRAPERNVRIHPEYQVAELAKAIEKFGQTRAIVIDEDNTVLIGNGLWMALIKLGRKDAVAHRVIGLSSEDKKKLMLSDNRLYALGLDDSTAVLETLRALSDWDIPGFDADLLSKLSLDTPDVTQDALDEYGRLNDETIASAHDQHSTTCPKCGYTFIPARTREGATG